MTDTDTLQRFIFENTSVRGEVIRLDQTLKNILKQHQLSAEIACLMAETLLATALLSATLKYDGELTVQFQGTGPLKMLVAKCDNQYRMRGTVKYDPEELADAIQADFESGQLVITIKNHQKNKQYQSIVAVNHQSIGEALENYFQQSEQLETRFWLAYQPETKEAVGFLLQKLPAATEDAELEWTHIQTLANTLTRGELLNWPTEILLKNLFHEETIQLFEPNSVSFYCPCDAQKMLNAIYVMGETEALDILKSNRFIEVTCEYCNNQFDFNADEIKRLFMKH